MGIPSNLPWLWLSAGVAGADLVVKRAMEAVLADGAVPLLPVLTLSLGYNTGVSFGMFADPGGWQRWPLAALSVVIVMALVVWLVRQPPAGEVAAKTALALIIGGAAGRRATSPTGSPVGHVTDFIQLHWQSWTWPRFNLADVAITCGAAVLVMASNWGGRKKTHFGRNDATADER